VAYHKSLAGVGWISLVPSGTYPDTVVLDTVTGITLDITEEDADLWGPGLDILDSFPTQRTVSGQITCSAFSTSLLYALTNGVTVAANRPIGYTHQATIPTTPFQITVPLTAPTRSFTTDLGVINLTNGVQMTAESTATASNVYAVDSGTGTYTFNTADSGDSVLIYYRATPSTADGKTAEIAVPSTVSAPKYGLHCYRTLAGKSWGIYVPAARIPKLGASFKRDTWGEVTLEWKATLDANNKLFYAYGPE
jgi:hypothetical protein